MSRKILMCLLAFLMVFSLAACQEEVPPTDPPVTEAPTDPPPSPQEVYGQALAQLESLSDITLDVKQTMTMRVGGQTFEEVSEQVLAYVGRNTENLVIHLEESVQAPENYADTEENEARLYTETYGSGNIYITLEDNTPICGALTAGEAAQRYIPVRLLDAALYEEVTLEESGTQTLIHFAKALDAEAWALPEGAELEEASGSAVITDGKLETMTYTVTYRYGSTRNTWQVETTPRAEAMTVTLPENAGDHLSVQCVDALWVTLRSNIRLASSETASLRTDTTITSQAGGFVYTESSNLDLNDMGSLMLRLQNDRSLISASGTESASREEIFRDGTYTVTVDNGLPASQTGLKEADIRQAIRSMFNTYCTGSSFWEGVTLEDLGSLYLLTFTYNEDFGNNMQSTISQLFWGDVAFLNQYASKYVTNEVNGYLAIDKYTGMPTASGMYYEGVHTIDADDCILSMRVDQAIELPSFEAYKQITDELPAEEEPENKATPLFYHVTGPEGQEMWLLGTIHVGDTRTGFLPKELYDAFAASDALALEINAEAFEAQLESDPSLANRVAKAYIYPKNAPTRDFLDEELHDLAVKYLKATGNYSENMLYMKASVWENIIQNFYLGQGHQLYSDLGVEERLIELAKAQEKPIREVESSIFQIEMSTGWSNELQQLMLEDTLDTDAEELWAGTMELYELWCQGDEDALRAELADKTPEELTEEEREEYNKYLALHEEYDKAMQYDRNENMLKAAVEYLESDDVVFYAVGLAHLLNETNGLVDALRDAGYTVEPVVYQ